MFGQPARVDAKHKVVWSVPATIRYRSCKNCEVIHPAVGIRMEKTTRTEVPDGIMRLRRVWSTAVSNRNGDVADAGLAGRAGVARRDDNFIDARRLCNFPGQRMFAPSRS